MKKYMRLDIIEREEISRNVASKVPIRAIATKEIQKFRTVSQYHYLYQLVPNAVSPYLSIATLSLIKAFFAPS